MLKKLVKIAITFIVLFFLFMVWYDYTYSMEVVETKEINNTSYPKKVLIASQGSDYKNKVVNKITDYFTSDSIYFQIIDVSLLNEVSPDDWNAIVIFHVWEIWKPEPNAKKFLQDNYNSEKMFVVCTSGSGDNRIDSTDGITGASSIELVDQDADTIINWLNEALTK